MAKIFYKMTSEEDYQKLTSKLTEMSQDPDHRVNQDGNRDYYSFVLPNEAMIVGAKEGGLVELHVKDLKHADETRTLLSQLTGIPTGKFLPSMGI